MERIGHVWRVKPGMAQEYDRRHVEIWPELRAVFHALGVRSYEIYRWGEILFSHMDVEDYDRLVAGCEGNAVMDRWEEHMADLIEYPNADPRSGWPERLQHVWSLAAPAAGGEEAR
jgi:L-rhamnose mutarotase